MNERENASCLGKYSFPNKHAAKQALDRSNRNKDRALNTYKCSNCGQIHIGTSSLKHR